MGKGLRLSEKWFHRGLWLVALVFAGFLIGLGGTVVGDLPQVERTRTVEDFMDPAATAQQRAALEAADGARRQADDALEQARLRLKVARSDTRSATQRADQDTELIRHGADPPGQKRLPRLRTPGGPQESGDRLLPALRHRPVRPLRPLRRTQERVLEVLPRLRCGGGLQEDGRRTAGG